MLVSYVEPAADFFDVSLSEIRDPKTLPRVQWHLGHGPDTLNTSETWPPEGIHPLNLYLTDAHTQ